MTSSRITIHALAVLVLAQTIFLGPLLADDVRVRSTYPLAYGEYETASVENEFRAGTPTSGAITNIYGDVHVLGDVVITKPANCRVRIAPKMGPRTGDGLTIDSDGNATVSLPPAVNLQRLKVSTVLIGKDFYAWGDPADSPTVVGMMHGHLDPDTSMSAHLRRKGVFASRPTGSPTLNPAAGTYGPLRMDGREIQFGVEYQFRGDDTWAGVLSRVLIGTRVAWTPPVVSPQPEVFLQVGNPTETPIPTQFDYAGADGTPVGLIPPSPPGGAGSGWRIFSSRDYKKDIVPLTPTQCGAALDKIAHLDVVKYRFKSEPKSSTLHTGLIAEDLPEMIKSPNGKSLNLAEAYAYAAAALKALKLENDALKARLALLESKAGKGHR